jgi:hypothetical protein
MGASALIALILANLPAILQAGSAILGFVTQVRAAAVQTGQWTPAMEAAFNAAVAAANNSPEWQTDSQIPRTGSIAPGASTVPAAKP